MLTGSIAVSGVKIKGESDCIACVYGFDADKFFASDYVDSDGIPHMLDIYAVVKLVAPKAQDLHDEL